MLVEDDPLVLMRTKLYLESQGYQVIKAENGQIALDLVKNNELHPDIVVSDINMPVMDGYTLFENCVNIQALADIPFIFLSSLSSPHDIRVGKRMGVDDYITKPFDEEDLLASIEGKLTRKMKNQALKERFISNFPQENEKGNATNFLEKDFEDNSYFFLVDWDDVFGPR